MDGRKRSRFTEDPNGTGPVAKKLQAEEPLSPRARARQIAAKLSLFSGGGGGGSFGDSSGGLNQLRKKVYVPVNENPDVNFIGLLIGPKGQTNRQMCEESGAKITIRGRGSKKDPTQDENDDLHVLICAEKAEQVEKAEKMVRDILFDPNRAQALKRNQLSNLGGRSSLNGLAADPDTVVRDVKVPSNLCGAVIGRQGATIRDIIDKSGAHVQVENAQEGETYGSQRSITVTGKKEQVDRAEELILQVIKDHQTRRSDNQNSSAPGAGGAFKGTLRLPNSKVGLVIGRQGSTVKVIQQKHRCQVTIPDGPDADNHLYRTIEIVAHSQQDIDNAKQEILITITPPGMQATGNVLTEDLAEVHHVIPNDKVGLVIGKQGVTIKGIQTATGCRIQIPPDPDPNSNPPTRTLTISGNRGQVDKAIVEINKFVYGRGPQDSSYSHHRHQQQQQQHHQHQYQQQQAGWDYSQQDWTAQWQQYYASMGQWQQSQQHQQPAVAQQQQQPAAAAPGVPGAAQAGAGAQAQGEQKYTKAQWEQWKQYYKQFGYEMAEECPPNLRADPFE